MRTSWIAIGIAAIVLAACQAGTRPPAPAPLSSALGAVRLTTSVDQASMDRGRAAYEAAVARGMVYHVTGRVGNIHIATVDGQAHVSAQALPGESVQVTLVKGTHDTVDFAKVVR